MARDYYAVLGLPPTADEKAIKAAYKRLAHQYHPDKTQGDPKRQSDSGLSAKPIIRLVM